ncbi:hypothetical protein MIND_00996600 [Mycena indigotica]|uniref:Uncharacterized protein n=1 Tax=Mycena indigotica TaxID=2126181 RepID=A0A8H6S9D6_9AGAR|nr:uncharacterized protein MIND_00996600 [Mycena indigotica]KAF7294600.1 hypothetical protein MIND_00996600 [Mycena indigotica]
MSSSTPKLLPFSRPTSPIRSAIFKSPPDVVPSVEELESLQEELRQLKTRTLERAKKAGEDLKTIEDSMRRIKEREKGKAKQLEKVKRERDYTPDPELIKPRLSSQPLSDELKKKHKKKRKREDESDQEPGMDAQRPRKSTPPAPHTHPPKAQKSTPSSVTLPKVSMPVATRSSRKPTPTPQINGVGDFSIPPPISLLPTRPIPNERPKPGPSKPTDVMEDFSMAKQPTQTPVSTFYTSVEPFLRPITEEDIGYLEHTNDEVEPFIMPRLGRHYLDVWAEQDALANGLSLPAGAGQLGEAPADIFAPPAPKWDPSTLNEADLVTEGHGHGLLTERVLSALLPVGDGSAWKGVKAAEDAMEGRPGGSGAAAARKERLNVTELENRIRDTMRYHGLLETVPDYSEKVDDPIASALRFAQRELRQVVARNKFRKAKLVEIARSRLGYQEYLENRDLIDRNISNTYTKLQKKSEPKVPKKKKKFGDASASGTPVPGAGDSVPPLPPPCPAASGLGPDDDNRLIVSEQLKHFVEMRRQFVDMVEDTMNEMQAERPGLLWGFPQRSIYEGMEEAVNAMLLGRHSMDVDSGDVVDKGKGKERASWDLMDIYLTLVDPASPLERATSVTENLGKINGDTAPASLQKAGAKIRQAAKGLGASDAVAQELLEAAKNLEERISPLFTELKDANTTLLEEVQDLREQLLAVERQRHEIKQLKRSLTEIDQKYKKAAASAERRKAAVASEKDENSRLSCVIAEQDEVVAEKENEAEQLRAKIERRNNRISVLEKKLKVMSRQAAKRSRSDENEDPDESLQIEYSFEVHKPLLNFSATDE